MFFFIDRSRAIVLLLRLLLNHHAHPSTGTSVLQNSCHVRFISFVSHNFVCVPFLHLEVALLPSHSPHTRARKSVRAAKGRCDLMAQQYGSPVNRCPALRSLSARCARPCPDCVRVEIDRVRVEIGCFLPLPGYYQWGGVCSGARESPEIDPY